MFGFTGLIPLLRKALIKSHAKGTTEKAYLCSEVAVHVGSEFWDRGWGCGYVNCVRAYVCSHTHQIPELSHGLCRTHEPTIAADVLPSIGRSNRTWGAKLTAMDRGCMGKRYYNSLLLVYMFPKFFQGSMRKVKSN